MVDRFQKLFSLENNLYIENAPIIISAAALLKDTKSGNIVVQIKFKSVSNKNIKGVKISLHAYDVSGKEINGVDDYQYLDLNIANGQSFGSSKAIVMPETTTRSFNIKSLTVIFADSSIWENASPDFVSIPNANPLNLELKNEELVKQYKIATTNKAYCIPKTFLNLWTCCCGEINSEEYCTNCGTNKNDTFSKYNITDLTEAMNLRLEKEKEEQLELERKNEEIRNEKKRKNKRVSIISAIVFLVVAVIMTSFIIINTVIIPNVKYNKAIALMNNGKHKEAISIFTELNDYKDCKLQINNCNTAIKDGDYNNAITLMEKDQYEKAITAFEQLDGYKDSNDYIKNCKYNFAIKLKETNVIESYELLVALNGYKDSVEKAKSIYDQYLHEKLKSLKVGYRVEFGTYEQDNNLSNGKEPVEWYVLAKENNKILLISKYVLDCKPYNATRNDVTWETSSLREWLNDTFINNAFSLKEEAMIMNTRISADKNPSFTTNPGNETRDKVFILSVKEANDYLGSFGAKNSEPTDYVIANRLDDKNDSKEDCWYWLRSPGNTLDSAAFSYSSGLINEMGFYVDYNKIGIRPAMWIDISK